MANKKITELDAITTLASTDVVPVVDVSADTTHKITTTNLFRTLPDGTAAAPSLSFASDAANGIYLASSDTVGISTGGTQRVTVDGSGNVTISGDLTVSGATTTVESTTVTIDDKNIELGSVATPTDTTADGGGITLKGATDKEIKWVNSTGYWTFNTGIDVTGEVQCDSLDVDGGADISGQLTVHSHLNIGGELGLMGTSDGAKYLDVRLGSDTFRIRGTSGGDANHETLATFTRNGPVNLFYDNSSKLATKSDGVDVTGEVQCDSLDVDGTVDIAGDIQTYGHLDLRDTRQLKLGNSDDLKLYHDGSHSVIEQSGTGHLYIRNKNDDQHIFLQTDNGSGDITSYVKCDGADGAVKLYHYGTQKLNTKSDGIDVTGEVQCDSLDVDGAVDITGAVTLHANLDLQDSDSIFLGTGDDLRLFHNGSTSHIQNDGGGLFIDQNVDDGDISLRSDNGSGSLSTYVLCDGSTGNVRLYHYGTEKFKTKSDGIDVTGEVQCDSLNVDGIIDIDATRISYSSSNEHLKFLDNIELVFGNGDDLRIYHDGSNSRIHDGGAGVLAISGSEVHVQSSTQGETCAKFKTDAEVELRYNNAIKFVTKSDGIDVTGEVQCDSLDVDGGSIDIDTTNDSPLDMDVTDSGPNYVSLRRAGTRKAYYGFGGSGDNFEIVNETSSGQLALGTNNLISARLDSSGRLLLGTTTEGQANADNLTIADSGECGITIRSGTTNNGSLFFSDVTSGTAEYSGYVQYDHNSNTLYFGTNSTQRLAINSNGAWGIEGASNYGTSGQVLTSNGNDAPTWQDAGAGSVGGANAISMNDNVKINFGASNDLQIYHDGNSRVRHTGAGDLLLQSNSDVYIQRASDGHQMIVAENDGPVKLYHDNSQKFATKSDGVDITGELQCDTLDVDGNADITGNIVLNGDLDLQDSNSIKLGTSDDFILIHNGSNTHLENYTGGLYIDQRVNDNDIHLRSDNGSGGLVTYVLCDGSEGSVKLYHYGLEKFNTKSDGVNVAGEVQCDSLDVDGTANISGTTVFQGDVGIGNTTPGNSFDNGKSLAFGDNDTGIRQNGDGILEVWSNNAQMFRFRNGGNSNQSYNHLNPSSNNSLDLGTSSLRWRNVYTNDLNLSNEGSTNDVDGTWGSYTIQEGEDDLFLINRRNGKKYKFNLTEVS